jgi:hypothetical protein
MLHMKGDSNFIIWFSLVKVKVKESRNRPGVAQRVPGDLGSQISWHLAREGVKVVILTHRPPLTPGMFLVLIFTRGWVNPRTTVRSEGNSLLKKRVTPSGIDTGTVRLTAQRLNHYATPGPDSFWYYIYLPYGLSDTTPGYNCYESFAVMRNLSPRQSRSVECCIAVTFAHCQRRVGVRDNTCHTLVDSWGNWNRS